MKRTKTILILFLILSITVLGDISDLQVFNDIGNHFRTNGIKGGFSGVFEKDVIQLMFPSVPKELRQHIQIIAVYLHPSFDWKENHDRYLIHIARCSDEKKAKEIVAILASSWPKSSPRFAINGSYFLISTSGNPKDILKIKKVFESAIIKTSTTKALDHTEKDRKLNN